MDYGFAWSRRQHDMRLSDIRSASGGYALGRAETLGCAGWPGVPASFDPSSLAGRTLEDMEGMWTPLALSFGGRAACDGDDEQQAWLRTLLSLASALASYPAAVHSLLRVRAMSSEDEGFVGRRLVELEKGDACLGLLLAAGAYQSGYAMTDLLGVIVNPERKGRFLVTGRDKSSGEIVPCGWLAESELNGVGTVTAESVRVLARCRWNRDSLVGHPGRTRPANSRLCPDLHATVKEDGSLAGLLEGSVDTLRFDVPSGPLDCDSLLFGPAADAIHVLAWDSVLVCGHAMSEEGRGLLEERDELACFVDPETSDLAWASLGWYVHPVRDVLDTLMAVRDCLAFLAYGDADAFPAMEPLV